ncbi:unnamed protein product [Enterobius vermicularis]|uniref:STAS domain-containing protein n=1 Tax=Enterobius vermicularis TaxID=51028 RepID=A0A0N4V094_ENTVE|nr:unnamed protein product [Enterobius vermicularis]
MYCLVPLNAFLKLVGYMEKCSKSISCFRKYFPIFEWISCYKLKHVPNDVIAGITVGIYNVPQAMAYAVLARLPPVIGLYSSFFPPLLYAIFGTSSQISVGMFSVTALLVGSVNERLSVVNGTGASQSEIDDVLAVKVTTAMDLTIALVLGLMYFLRLHFIVAYMSNELVSGYTVGAACQVIGTQLPKIFGLKIPRHADTAVSLNSTNLPDLITSAACILTLHIGKWYINPRVTAKSGLTVPFELIVVSSVFDNTFSRFPVPSVPEVTLMPKLIFDSIITAIIIFAITISICKVVCENHSGVSARQELFALTTVELISSFFSCHPACGSLTRTVINCHCGAKSQCVLSAIIVVALQTMFLHVKQIRHLWKVSKVDLAIWLVGCFATVIWDVSQGLGIAVGFALITVVLRSQWYIKLKSLQISKWLVTKRFSYPAFFRPTTLRLQKVDSSFFGANFNSNGYRSEGFKSVTKFRSDEDKPGVESAMLYRFDAPLLFLNVDYFKKEVTRLTEFSRNSFGTAKKEQNLQGLGDAGNGKNDNVDLRYLILDASGFSDIDYQGVLCLEEVSKELQKKQVELLIANAKG